MIHIKFKKLHKDATMPTRSHDTDTGYDITSCCDPILGDSYIEYRTGIALDIPEGYHVKIYPRSSISKKNLALCNSVGVIDQGYKGEIILRFKYTENFDGEEMRHIYEKNDRIGQLVIDKTYNANFVITEEIGDSSRSDGGFGSTGN
mgnify:CR=1 FL=1